MSRRPLNLAYELSRTDTGNRLACFLTCDLGAKFKIAIEAKKLGYRFVVINEQSVDIDRWSRVLA